MTYYANDVHPVPPDRHAEDCDDQLPLISQVGRGVKGDSGRVRISDPDTCSETYLEGGTWDDATQTFNTEWTSKNINGGELSYQYNLRPFTIPRTFTITFVYRRPGRCEWSWTTPAIPYIWTLDPAGKPDENPDHIVGSGVSTLFIRTMHGDWNERLHYPEGTTREDFNAPQPEEGWSATITFGKGGDIEVPDFDDIAKVIGISKEDLYNIIENNVFEFHGIEAKDLMDYINKADKRDLDHIHDDLGFCGSDHGPDEFGASPITGDSYSNVKQYIDAADESLQSKIKTLESEIKTLKEKLQSTGINQIPNGTQVAYGNINVFSGDENHYIRTRSGTNNNDIKAM